MDVQAWLATLSPEAWFTGAAAVIALAALFFTGVAARAASDQTKIQRQLRIDAAQPYVWVDIREDRLGGAMLHFEIGNSGPTVATNIRVGISTPLPTAHARNAESMRRLEDRLAAGFKSLAPGRVIAWSLGVGHQILAEEGGPSYTFTIDADGPFGPLETLTYTVDIDDWREMRDRPLGTLHMVRQSIDSLAKQLDKSTTATLRQLATVDEVE
jgi:hypothetical protein